MNRKNRFRISCPRRCRAAFGVAIRIGSLTIFVFASMATSILTSSTSAAPRIHSDPEKQNTGAERNDVNQGEVDRSPVSSSGNDPSKIDKLKIGFDGRWCLGKWAPVWITHRVAEVAYVELETIDGDGVPVRYISPVQETGDSKAIESQVRVGRLRSYITVRLLDAKRQPIAERKFRFNPSDRVPPPQASTTAIILSLGSDIGIESFVGSSRSTRRDRIAIHVADAGKLPTQLEGYDGVRQIVISTRGLAAQDHFSPGQLDALTEWVRNGGHLILSTSLNSEQWIGENGFLESLLPGKFKGIVDLTNSDALENFVGSQANQLVKRGGEPLRIAGVTFENPSSADIVQNKNVLIARRAVGFGQVTFAFFDFEDPMIEKWNARNQLLASLIRADTDLSFDDDESGQQVTGKGFTDISGQLRTPLDQFDGVGFINFTTVALLIVTYILMVGPGDYFFNKYVLRRMQLTWITFPVITLLFCGLAFWIFKSTKPDTLRLNHVEVVDIDADSKSLRGTIWSQIYSSRTDSHNVKLPPENSLGLKIKRDRVGWEGLPGRGLGGMQTRARSSLFQSAYVADQENNHTKLQGVPIQVASSKPLFANYHGMLMEDVRSNLKFDSNTERFTGTLTNPLDVELSNCVIIFRNFLIRLNSNVTPGQVVDVGLSDRVDLSAFFKRRTRQGDAEINTRWDSDDTNIPRILNMMMFFRAVGGKGYTELTHDYKNVIDLSSHLDLNRAILVGRAKIAATPLQIDGKPAVDRLDTKWTIVRILFPVDEITK